MEKRMLWLGLMLMVIGLCSSGALATTMGPPVAGLETGQFSIGLDYSTSEIGVDGDGEFELFGETDFLGEFDESGPVKFKDDIESDMIFANLGYGISDKLEVFLRLGMADLSSDDAGFDGSFGGSSEFAWGLGAKATFYEETNLKLGGLFQITLGSADDEITMTVDDPSGEEQEVDTPADIYWYEIKIAVGPAYELTEGCSIYGGPFYHLISGDLDAKDSRDDVDIGGGDTASYDISLSADIEEQSNFGGYIGAQIDLAENLPLCVEYQFTGDANVLGASLVYRF